jgi:hypothetical protein
MQAASDIFLGWTHGQGKHQFYLRQLRDMKIKPLVELFRPVGLFDYAGLCWTLARAHACSGDPAMIAGYMGKSDVFDKAVALSEKLMRTRPSKTMPPSRMRFAKVGSRFRQRPETRRHHPKSCSPENAEVARLDSKSQRPELTAKYGGLLRSLRVAGSGITSPQESPDNLLPAL